MALFDFWKIRQACRVLQIVDRGGEILFGKMVNVLLKHMLFVGLDSELALWRRIVSRCYTVGGVSK
jgi:uncharacterized protein (UPF0548 family)